MPGDFEEGNSPSAHVEEVVADFLERRIATVARPCADAGRHCHRMHEPHAEHADIEVDGHFHVVGIQRSGARRNSGGRADAVSSWSANLMSSMSGSSRNRLCLACRITGLTHATLRSAVVRDYLAGRGSRAGLEKSERRKSQTWKRTCTPTVIAQYPSVERIVCGHVHGRCSCVCGTVPVPRRARHGVRAAVPPDREPASFIEPPVLLHQEAGHRVGAQHSRSAPFPGPSFA